MSPVYTKVEKGNIVFKIGKGKVDGGHFSFVLETRTGRDLKRSTGFSGDVTGGVAHAVESVVLDGEEIHRIAFTMNRVQQQ